ncbi:YifB family Mg chelatase-like AAA ATPase [Aestuariibacter sp. A3R04]|uniref:YifB family Mg chelatase-like AAA ATPase n=1 Tax=Aestuariibacter sp. A3R04 TaxID=2841571 RepID=UPI001C095E68|nr:YifB family Mg chelatase-like AAA ATPase [Aestuariibacter sp. A3R04]MBU3020294.1 YifB family Mg chelatase-like AAA ATPase [Aestuariibacter sp. A3R04]
MGMAVVNTRAGSGMEAPLVRVEVHLANGLPSFQLVGMAETSVKEARDRVRSALINSGFEFPAKRITVNLSPASIAKQGGQYDLAIAIGILVAHGTLAEAAVGRCEFLGELALTGELRGISGIIPAVIACRNHGNTLFHPLENRRESAIVEGATRYAADSLLAVYLHLSGTEPLVQDENAPLVCPTTARQDVWHGIHGQHQAKRALMIAAAGAHNLLFTGPPGTGKSLLASRLLHMLPPLSPEEALEVAALHSLKQGGAALQIQATRPFRSPHHTASAAALTGGGANPQPGEVSLAHHGVLFLDELPEFGRRTLDVLREPLETGEVHISRASANAVYPARFQLIAAMNPSPTGDIHDWRTPPDQILRYLSRVSGPLLDRIDIQVEVPRLPEYQLSLWQDKDEPDDIKKPGEKAMEARNRQLQRQGVLNAHIPVTQLADCCQLTEQDLDFIQLAAEKLSLSMRAFHRTLKVARTIADLAGEDHVNRHHLAEALGYRALDSLIQQLSSG